ncbi:MAG: RNA polymerase sigma factor [Terriglobales bacterium]
MARSFAPRTVMEAPAPARSEQWSDERLVTACLDRDSEAWGVLIDRYKNLIYSIPVRLGLHQDANDIFQSVCLDLLQELQRLREAKALPQWLIQTCYHKCLACRRRAERQVELDTDELPHPTEVPKDLLAELEQEQEVRDAVANLPDRCRRMVEMLFYEDPPRSYDEVAKELNLATGSIGFIRGRCLQRMRKELEGMTKR